MPPARNLKRALLFAAVCLGVKAVFALLPETVVLPLFCRVPAEAASFYYGVPLNADALSFTAKGVTLAVTRACAATDFFALVSATLVLVHPLHLITAYAFTLVVNTLRIIALVPVDAVFPKENMPVVHLLTGVAFFLPAFVFIWSVCQRRFRYGR